MTSLPGTTDVLPDAVFLPGEVFGFGLGLDLIVEIRLLFAEGWSAAVDGGTVDGPACDDMIDARGYIRDLETSIGCVYAIERIWE
jgi:hypothetical protein